MGETVEANERIVCAILAEQVAAVRDRMDTATAFDLLWRTSALLSWLSGLLSDIAANAPPPAHANPVLEREREEAITEIAEIRHALGELAFIQAQRQDFAKQIADCVVVALERMAVAEMPPGTSFSSADLASLYVSDDQRRLHEEVIRRLGA